MSAAWRPRPTSIDAEATDFVRANPTLDMGITGVMKMAHLAEALGLDCRDARLPARRTATACRRSATPTTTSWPCARR